MIMNVNLYIEHVADALPRNCFISNTVLCEKVDGKLVPLNNFLPVVTACIKSINVFSGKSSLRVRVGAIIEDNGETQLTAEREFEISALDNIDFQNDVDRRCCVENGKMSKSVIATCLSKQLAKVEEVLVLEANRLGHFCYEGRHGFVAGNEVLGQDLPEIRIADNLKVYELVDKRLRNAPLDSAKDFVYNLIHFNPRISPVLFMANILGMLHDFFSEAGAPIRFSFYLMGEQSTGKTTLATLFCSMYNRDVDLQEHLHNLTATEAKLQRIMDVERDMPVIIDDLRKSDSRRIMRDQEVRFDNLVRSAGNGVGKETVRSCMAINGFAIFIGEYALRNPSTNNRILMLEFRREDLDAKKLRDITRGSVLLALFYREFIQWALKNHDKIIDHIKKSINSYQFARSKMLTCLSLRGEYFWHSANV